jgi:hypothetical protein
MSWLDLTLVSLARCNKNPPGSSRRRKDTSDLSYEHPAPVSRHSARPHRSCVSCGFPSHGVTGGRTLVLAVKAANRFCRETRRTVWTCCDHCAYQALAIARFGSVSSKWPVSFAQFITTNPLPPSDGCHRPQTIGERRVNGESPEQRNRSA